MKIVKLFIVAMLLLVMAWLLMWNVNFSHEPAYESYGHAQINTGVVNQLAHLNPTLHGGAAVEMQAMYPEGFVFLNALYGLTWVEVIQFLSEEEELYNEGLAEIDWVLAELDSDEAKSTFPVSLNPRHGIFYRGWCNYLLGRKLKAVPRPHWDSLEVKRFRQNSAEIIEAMQAHSSPFLESYRQASWPADMVVGMASVAIHEELFPGTYQENLAWWLEAIESRTDELGLLPHSSHWETGEVLEPARGSSQSLILNFLVEIDSAYAAKKFILYKESFLDYRIGLPGIREYPKGSPGVEDVDSGPVIWGIGGAASIVGQRTMALYGAEDLAAGLRNSIEAFGTAITTGRKKKYLFGALAMADAFIAWSNSVESARSLSLTSQTNWGTQARLVSVLLLILAGWALFRLVRPKRPKT